MAEKTTNTDTKPKADNASPMKQKGSPKVKIDKEFKDLLPSLPMEDFEKLKKSILKDGCRDPLVVWKGEGSLVDGYHRFEICKENHKEYAIVEKSFKDRDSVIAWIIANQKNRRNMNRFQWAKVILRLKPKFAAEAHEKKREGGGADRKKSSEPVRTMDKLAKMAGMTAPTLRQVEFILNNADDETIVKLEKGDSKISINSVYETLQKLKDKKEATKPAKKKESKREATQKQINLVVKAVKRSSPDSAGQIAFVISSLDGIEKEFQEVEDRSSFYDGVIEWAKNKKNASPET